MSGFQPSGGGPPRPAASPARVRAGVCLLAWLGMLGPLPLVSAPHSGHHPAAVAHAEVAVPPGAAPTVEVQGHASPSDHPDLVVDREAGELRLRAVAHPEAFRAGLPPDHQYHALVQREGGAAAKALFVTDVPDTTVARVLRELGAEDGGGVPLAAWTLRWVPLVPQPSARVDGTPLEIRVRWDNRDPVTLASLLEDPGGRGLDLRFGGNEEHDAHWNSGCILCLFSCPGGVISNAAYSIRDHQRGETLFAPSRRMPPEGTEVEIIISLRADSG